MLSSGPLTLVVADDQPLFRAGLARTIQHHPQVKLIAELDDGRTALDVVRDRKPNLAIIDLTLPGVDGLAVLGAITREKLPTRVLLLAANFGDQELRRARGLGAAAMLSKRVDGAEVLDALLAVARGETVLDRRLKQSLDADGRFARDDGTRPLTAREHEVLRLMAEGRSGPQIARELFVSPSTIKSHIENLYGKLGVSHRGAAVAEGMRRGLLH